MRRTDPLNDHQLIILRWIADGCPPGVLEGYSYKQTARALQDRQLVRVSRAGGDWQAELTDAGRFYVQHGEYPNGGGAVSSAPRQVEKVDQQQAAGPPTTRTISVDELLTRLQAGGGAVTVEEPITTERAAWRRAIDAAKRSGRLPAGKHLSHRGRNRGDLIIELRDGVHPAHQRAADRPPPVVVPDEVPALHPLLEVPPVARSACYLAAAGEGPALSAAG